MSCGHGSLFSSHASNIIYLVIHMIVVFKNMLCVHSPWKPCPEVALYIGGKTWACMCDGSLS